MAEKSKLSSEINKAVNSLDGKEPNKIGLVKWLAIIAVLFVELFLYTWCRVSYTETGFRISKEKEKQKVLKAYTDALSMENDRLLSPERIAYIATTRLNLIIPEPSQLIYMDM